MQADVPGYHGMIARTASSCTVASPEAVSGLQAEVQGPGDVQTGPQVAGVSTALHQRRLRVRRQQATAVEGAQAAAQMRVDLGRRRCRQVGASGEAACVRLVPYHAGAA